MKTYDDFQINVKDVDVLVSEAEALLNPLNPPTPTEASDGRRKANVLTRSGIVLLTGYFEGYIRDVLAEFIATVNDLRPTIGALPDPLVMAHIEHGVSACRSSPTETKALRRTVAGTEVVRLEEKLFTKTGGNPTVDMFESLFASIGVPDAIDALTFKDFQIRTWFMQSQVTEEMNRKIDACLSSSPGDVIALRQRLVEVIDAKWTPKKKRRAVGYVHEIEQLLKKRNRIAHGEGREPITPLELSDLRDHVVKLAKGLAALLDAKLSAITRAHHRRGGVGRR